MRSRAAPSRRVGARLGRSRPALALAREKHKGLLIPVGASADHTVVDDVFDHGDAPPFLARSDVRKMHLDDRHGEELERIPDRVAVVRPRAWIDDDAVRPRTRLVAGVDELALV